MYEIEKWIFITHLPLTKGHFPYWMCEEENRESIPNPWPRLQFQFQLCYDCNLLCCNQVVESNKYFSLLWIIFRTSLVTHWLRTCLPVQETEEMWVQSLGQEDPLKEEMATHSNILAWRIPWVRSLACYGHRVSKSRTQLNTCTYMLALYLCWMRKVFQKVFFSLL